MGKGIVGYRFERWMRLWAISVLLALCFAGVGQADTCAVGHQPCSLPFTATGTATQILAVRTNRTDLVVCNQDVTNVLYVILGQGVTLGGASATTNYGFPIQPQTCFHLGVGTPNAGSQINTYTSDIWVITGGASILGSYAEKTN